MKKHKIHEAQRYKLLCDDLISNSITGLDLGINLPVIFQKLKKKVLLRERKRHTSRRVASARYAALSNGGGGTPSSPARGVPPGMGLPLPPPGPGMGYPPLSGPGMG